MTIPLLWVEETPSTNGYLKEMFLRGGVEAPLAVAARRQTAGRGRLGRTWACAEGQALALSILVPRALPTSVTLGVGVAVCRAIEQVGGVQTGLKWPNDILCNNRKIGGILCEGLIGEPCATVLGIGVNVAQTAAYFEKHDLPFGGSLLSETKKTVAVDLLAEVVVAAVEQMLKTLEAKGLAPLKEEFSARCVTLEKEVTVLSLDGAPLLCGRATGIDEEGGLLVTDESGATRSVCAGEVSVRGVYGYV